MDEVAALFAEGSEIGSDGSKGACACSGTETPGGFLLEFRHPDIAFSLIVIEGHWRIGQETQCIVGRIALFVIRIFTYCSMFSMAAKFTCRVS